MVRKTKEDALETRNRLLDTAELVFSERGVTRTSLAEIAEAAGLTRGAIYWHFENKLDLFNAMMERITLPMETAFDITNIAKADNPIDLLRAQSRAMLEILHTNAQIRRVFDIVNHKCEYVADMAPLRERNQECRSNCINEMEVGIKLAIKKTLLPKTLNPRIAAIGLHSLMDGLIVNWLLDPTSFSLKRDAMLMIDHYWRGLGAAIDEPVTKSNVSANAKKTTQLRQSLHSKT
jgi:TetR/AcrR family transcriptional regulator, acrAB operon repressor